MAFVWNPSSLPSLVSSLVALASAGFIISTGAGRTTNRILASLYATYGISFAWIALQYSLDAAAEVIAAQVVATIGFVTGSLLYLVFLGHALSRAPRVLRSRAWLAGTISAIVIASAVMVARTDLLVAGAVPVSYAPYEAVPGPLFLSYFALAIAISIVGLTLAVREYSGSPVGTPARRRAGFFLVAFGIQDTLLVITPTAAALTPPDSWVWLAANLVGFPFAFTVAPLLVGYGIVRYQLFDIDVRIKLGVKRTTLAGAFLAVVFVVAQLVQAFAGLMFGAIAGAVAAGLLLVAIHPLQRMAERVSDAAMPHVSDTAEYRTVRKREVYLAAVESAMDDGEITDKERNVLATLADQLGLGVKETVEIERAAKDARRAA